MKEEKGLNYQGYDTLNRTVYFKGGIPANMAVLLFLSLFGGLPIISLIIPIYLSFPLFGVLLLFIIKFAKKIGEENLRGDRNYVRAYLAFQKTPKKVMDRDFFSNINNLPDELKI